MNTSNMTDQELVLHLLAKNEWTHEQLAGIVAVTRDSVTKWANGKRALRPMMRKRLEDIECGLIYIGSPFEEQAGKQEQEE